MRKKIVVSSILLFSVGLVAIGALMAVRYIDDYAQPWRMRETPAVRPHEIPLLVMDEGSVPFRGGDSLLRRTDPLDLENPLPFNQESIDAGKKQYGYYCAMCHGDKANGLGPVGQSFYPLPRNLTTPQVQEKSDGYLFSVISYGLKRMPALGTTVAQRDRWLIIHYLRSLASETEEQQ